MKIKKNDNVLIVKGKDKGKKGKVLKIISKTNKIVITGLNKYKKHIKPSKANPQGGIVDVSMAIDPSNVLVVCPSCSKSTRVKKNISKDTKTRICAKCSQSLDI